MERFASYDQFRAIERRIREAARAQGVKPLSNDFLLPETARSLIAEGRLSYEERLGNLYLLRDQGTFHSLSFVIADRGSVAPVPVPRATKVVWPYRVAMSRGKAASPEMDDLRDQAIRAIGDLAFDRARTLARLRRPAGCGTAGTDAAVAEGVRIDVARPGERDSVDSLLHGCLDPVLGELPDARELEADIAADRVLVARTDGVVIGALRAGLDGRVAWIRQIAVREAARGRHVGRSLVEEHIRRHGAEVRAFELWVDLANEPAVRLYRSAGYGPTGQRADEYLPR